MSSRLLLCGLVFTGALTTGANSALGELVVSGVVLAGRDRPLAEARVELVPVLSSYSAGRKQLAGETSPPVAASETGADGRFALRASEAGAFAVSLRLAGRAPMRFGDFMLTRSRELPPLLLPAVTDAAIQVVDAAGRPIANAWVAVVPSASDKQALGGGPAWKLEPRVARTSTAGTVVLPILQGEPVEVEVFVPGTASSWRAKPNGGVVRLPRESRLETVLRVSRAGGEPAEGILFRLEGYGWPVGVTDSYGSLPLRLPAGSAVRGELLADPGSSKAVKLSPHGHEPIQIQLARPATVRGRVLDAATGKGLTGALVAPAEDLGAMAATGDQGQFSLLVLLDGGFTFEAHARGYFPTRVTASAGELAAGRLPSVGLDPTAKVLGRVLGAGNQPLSAVSIEAVPEAMLAARPYSLSEPVSDRGASEPDGSFQLSGLRPSSRYELRARKTGYLPAVILVSTAPPRGRTPAVEMRLQPGRGAVGRVTDSDGRPLSGARVALRPSRREDRRPPETQVEKPLGDDDPATAHSDPDGRFRVAQCPAADVDVDVRLEGYAPARRVGFRVGPEALPLDLGTFVLRPGARLTGRVVNDRGRVVVRAEIFLFDRLPPEPAVSGALLERKPGATTGVDGSFVFDDLPAGVPQHLAVRAEGYMPAIVRGIRPPTGKPLLVRLERGVQLTGTVVDEQSQPLSRAEVGLTSQRVLEGDPYHRLLGRTVSRETLTDANGRFTIHDAPEGRAVLNASAEGFVSAEGIEIELPQRDPRQPVVLRLRRGANVWGRVSTTGGDAVAGARVLVGDKAAGSDAEGFYRLAGVAEGEHPVEVQHPSYHRVSRTVRIELGENRVDLELPAGVSVEGRVVDASGAPMAAAEVRLGSAGAGLRHEYRSRTDSDGLFRVEPVAADTYRLQATAPDRSSGEAPQPVVVEDQPVDGLEVVLEPGAVLSGRVLGLSPDQLALVSVEAQAENGRKREARVDASGSYQIRALAPGAWLVRATLWEDQKEARARVVITPVDRNVTRDLEFGRKLTLSGVVLFDEQPLPNAMLTLRGQRFAVERSVLTSFEGAFRLEELESDSYRLGISKPDQLLTHNQWLELAADRKITIRLTAATVSGVVRDAHEGKTIPGALIRLTPAEGPEFLIADSSQEDGSFHLLRVPPGSYRLSVSADGFVGAEQAIGVAAGEARSGLDFALQPTAGSLLQVGLEAGGVPPLVHVLVLDASGIPMVAETRAVDTSGRVRLATIPPGSWHLLVSAPAAATVTQAIVVPGEPLSVTLPPAGRLHLRVPALAATDLRATLTIFGPDQQALWTLGPGGQLKGSWPMTAGQVTIEGVPQGDWLLRVESTDGRAWTGGAVTAGSGDMAVTLGSSEPRETR